MRAIASKAPVVRSVKTLLGLLTVALLAVEGVLIFLATVVQDTDRAYTVGAGLFFLVLMAIVFVVLFRPSLIDPGYAPQVDHRVSVAEAAPTRHKYDVFVSSPMTALGENGYELHREDILRLVGAIEAKCQLTCYYAGRDRPTLDDFDAVDVGLRKDMDALKGSRNFLLILPEAVMSSVLVEAGMAIALGKPGVYLKRAGVNLPFVLEGAANSSSSSLPHIRKYDYRDAVDLVRIIQNNGREIFA